MDALNTLKATLTRPGLLISDPQIVDMATTDFRGWYKGNAVGLARPRSVREVQDVVRACRTAGCAIVAQGRQHQHVRRRGAGGGRALADLEHVGT
jgi:FAD/FMN-containing dehydrogenase